MTPSLFYYKEMEDHIMSQRFGIDVSRWQGSFDFARAKSKEGVEFAIIKAGGAL